MPTTERSSIEGPTLQRSPQTSRMGFASLVYPMSMVWASSLVRTSNTADSSLLLPHNKSLDASGGRVFRVKPGPARLNEIAPPGQLKRCVAFLKLEQKEFLCANQTM